jgi:biopolymer transport protein ExbD
MALKLAAKPDRYRLRQNSEINVTPFVDVMLVLLIIFMVALPAPVTTLDLTLPPAQRTERPAPPPVVINLAPNGLFIGETATSLDALPADLAKTLGGSNPTAQTVYLRADRKVRYQRFMQVMDRLHSAGFSRVGLVSEDL